MRVEELFEALAPFEYKSDITFIKRTLSRPLLRKKSEAHDFTAAAGMIENRIKWSSSSDRIIRVDLSNVDEELHSIIMRFTLAWYKKEVEEFGLHGETSKKDFDFQIHYLKEWLKDLKFAKFPQAELDVLYKSIIKPKRNPV